MKPIPILGIGLQSGYPSVTAQERINCYLEQQSDGESSRIVVYGSPGYTQFVDFGSTPVRGMYSFNEYLYVVHRDQVYKVNNAGSYTNLGALSTSSGRVYIACSGFELLFTDGTVNGRFYEIKDDTTVTITNASPAVVTWTAHNMPVGAALKFSTDGTLPSGLTAGTTYYIESVPSVDTFTVSATQGGAAINTTTAGTGTHTASTLLAPVTDTDYPALSTCTFMDGYFVGNEINTGKYYVSDLYQANSWDALNFASAESNPDNLLRVFGDHGSVMLFGTYTTEIVGNNGAEDFPFARVGYPVEWGLMATASVAKLGDSVAFLARNRMGEAQVVLMSGYNARRISTHDIERTLNNSSTLESATAFSYMTNGHQIYQLNAGGQSWFYDLTSGMWSQAKSYGLDRSRLDNSQVLINRVLASDYDTGKIYAISDSVYDEAGDPLVMTVTGRHIFNNQQRMSIGEVYLDMEPGVGLTSGQGVDPQIMLQVSRDGGHTWGNERWRTMGDMGAYLNRVNWFRACGRGYTFTFKFTISDPVKRCIIGAWIEAAA